MALLAQGGFRIILPDLLSYGLKVVFCGMAASTVSAQRGAYYAGPGNKFWDIVYQVGLTPKRMKAEAYRAVLDYGIGFTDVVKNQFGMDSQLVKTDIDRIGLTNKIVEYAPKVLCFNGKQAAQCYYGLTAQKRLDYGKQPLSIGGTVIFVLPSTSAAANRWWNEKYWLEAAVFIKNDNI